MPAAPPAPTPLWRWLPAVVWMALIFIASATPVPAAAGPLLPDKLIHAGIYGVLALLIVRALGGVRALTPSLAARALMLTVGYGITDEIHQAFVPTRQPDLLDVVADAAGAVAAVMLAAGWTRWRGV